MYSPRRQKKMVAPKDQNEMANGIKSILVKVKTN